MASNQKPVTSQLARDKAIHELTNLLSTDNPSIRIQAAQLILENTTQEKLEPVSALSNEIVGSVGKYVTPDLMKNALQYKDLTKNTFAFLDFLCKQDDLVSKETIEAETGIGGNNIVGAQVSISACLNIVSGRRKLPPEQRHNDKDYLESDDGVGMQKKIRLQEHLVKPVQEVLDAIEQSDQAEGQDHEP